MNNYLYHHGIKGQKWGVRRFRNSDGSLTAAGKRRQREEDSEAKSKELKNKSDELYKSTDAYKMIEKYRGKHPNSDMDDFYAHLSEHPKKEKKYTRSVETDEYVQSQKLSSDSRKLAKDYVKYETMGAALISSLTITPVIGLLTASVAPKGKKAALGMLAAIGTTSMLTLESARVSRKEHHETQRKYGIR